MRRLFKIGVVMVALLVVVGYFLSSKLGDVYGKLKKDDNPLCQVNVKKYQAVKKEGVINLLLVGTDKNENEQKENVSRRSDCMMVVTIDTNQSRIGVMSLMRDMYVDIPGVGKAKLNAAYERGGAALLYRTLAKTLRIHLDGYLNVNFDSFIKVVDGIGGISVTLTESEAKNLNGTNYISKKKYRNVKPGKNTLCGVQALGYCRIRHGKATKGRLPGVYTASGKGDDYGRVERQRIVVKEMIKNLRKKSLWSLLEIAEDVAPYIKTDLDKTELIQYVTQGYLCSKKKIATMTVPTSYKPGTRNGQSVLIINKKINQNDIEKFKKFQ